MEGFNKEDVGRGYGTVPAYVSPYILLLLAILHLSIF